ncbi:MAG: chemotaxis protein CheW, partial [Treponema sp.]|nr:chemotaxis protein CheW [Treponema sp.]
RSVLVLRGTFIPLVRLADALGVPRLTEDPESGEPRPDRRANLADRRGASRAGEGRADASIARLPARSGEERRYHAASDYSVVVVNSAGLRYALVVDELHDTMEIVVKPLGGHFSKLREYSGATILGNGSTALILDTTGLAARAGLVSGEGRDSSPDQAGDDEAAAGASAAGASAESLGLLLFGNGERERCAMRLESVDRVMKITRSDIDTVGKSRMITHDGATVPVFALGDALPVSDIMEGSGELALILARAADRNLGILATPPVDSLSTEAEIDTSTFAGRGLQGSAIIRGKTTLVVDVEDFARVVKLEWFSAGPTAPSPADRFPGSPGSKPATLPNEPGDRAGGPSGQGSVPAGAGALVLVADDSNFFRSRVREILAGAGYDVLEAVDGDEALALFGERSSALAAVVADIEMPGMDGFELSRRIRASGSGLPIIALTSLASDEDRRRAAEAGVDVFQVKLDEGELLTALGELIRNSGSARDRRK